MNARVCNKCSVIENPHLIPFCKDRSTCVSCRTKYHKKWQQNNSQSYTEYHRAYQVSRAKTDICYRLSRQLRKRLDSALCTNAKNGSHVSDLGCTIKELKKHIESKFQPGMTWDNWSRDGWHIDHVKPLSKFDLTDSEQLKEACHYTNLQPLWAIDNLKKHSN